MAPPPPCSDVCTALGHGMESRSQIWTLCFSCLYPARTSSDGTGSSEKKAVRTFTPWRYVLIE